MPASTHKLRPYTEEDLQPSDGRDGVWTRLELIDMDARFCEAMRRAHPELAEPQTQAESEPGGREGALSGKIKHDGFRVIACKERRIILVTQARWLACLEIPNPIGGCGCCSARYAGVIA
jgi:hypothetical protein